METARGGIGLAGELAARVEHGEDDFERRLARILRVLVHRHTAAVVGDGDLAGGGVRPFFQRDFDAVGVAGDSLVHRVVEHFGGEVVERALVDPADVHAGAAADGLEPFQHLDRGAVVGFFGPAGRQLFEQVVRHGNGYRTCPIPGAMGVGGLSGIIHRCRPWAPCRRGRGAPGRDRTRRCARGGGVAAPPLRDRAWPARGWR